MKEQNREKRKGIACSIIAIFLSFIMILTALFLKTHFLKDTRIGGIDCSYLSIENAIKKVEQEKKESIVTLSLAEDISYKASLDELGILFDYRKFEAIFEAQHTDWESSREYKLEDVISVDKSKTASFLKQIPELQREFVVEPKDAYLDWNGKEFYIQKEIIGIKYEFEELLEFAVKNLEENVSYIDFTVIGKVFPNIMEEDLEAERDQKNSIIDTAILFMLNNEEIVTLDSNTIRTWVLQNGDGQYEINTDDGILNFVEELSSKVDEANATMQFVPAEMEQAITLEVPSDKRPQLEKEQQISRIRELLGSKDPIWEEPIYDREFISDKLSSFIQVDITRQHLWFFLDGDLLVDSPCVTGNPNIEGYATPTGIYYKKNEATGKVPLSGTNYDGTPYLSYVTYWVGYYEGYGLHDASWRKQFGGEIYKTSGSHGCTNLPFEVAKTVFENIDETMPIIYYES